MTPTPPIDDPDPFPTPGAHTGFFNGRGTGLKAAMGPKVTSPKNPKTPRIWSTVFGWALIFHF